mmetsp:Transcript_770/g.1969  ORF Transcript_770/g.1969 Transcript_770/m.1969 type:complete len:144 (-) Transcript_770:1046-1477(-)
MKKQDEADGSAEETAGAKIANVRRKHAQDYQRKELYRNTMRYFEATPTPHHTTVKTQKALQALGRLPYALTSSEKLQLVNLHASAEVDVHVAVEECEDRIPEEGTAAILGCIQTHLGSLPDADEDGHEKEANGGEAMDVDAAS